MAGQIAGKLAVSILGFLGKFATDYVRGTDGSLDVIQEQLSVVQNYQRSIDYTLGSLMVKSNFGDRSQQLEEARTNILVRMDQFKDALGYAIDGCKKTAKDCNLSDNKQLQEQISHIGGPQGIRDDLSTVQVELRTPGFVDSDTLTDLVNGYYWNKYGGSEGLSAKGIDYGIHHYVSDIRGYFRSLASLQLTAIYLLSWTEEPQYLQRLAGVAIKRLDEVADSIIKFIPPGIDITDASNKGDAFFRQVIGNDDSYMIREASGEKRHLTLRTITGLAWPSWNFVGMAPWKGDVYALSPMDYKWKFEPVDGTDAYRLIGWDVRDHNEPKAVQWEKSSSDYMAGARNRYTTRNKGKDVIFKIIVAKAGQSSTRPIIRLIDRDLTHGVDGQTPEWFDNRAENPLTFEVEYQKGQRYNTDFRDSTSAFDR